MRVSDLLPYHNALNPVVWDRDRIDPKIKQRLLDIAQLFQSYLDIDDLQVYDVVLTGSLANYNYSQHSDFDLHLMVDYSDIDGDLAEKFLKAKKDLWNDQHDITIKGYDVELYAQDISETHASSGVYSLTKDQWLIKPKYQPPTINDQAVTVKANYYRRAIDIITDNEHAELDDIQQLKDKIRRMRRSGLQKQGEFSTENLVFKILRNQGYLKKLWDYYDSMIDRKYTMEDL